MIEEVVIRMGMDARPVSSALRGVRKDFDTFKADLKGLNVGSILKGGLGMVGIGLSVGALAAAAKGALDYAHEVGNLSEELGISAGTLQAFSMKVSKTGGDSETSYKALEKLSLTIGKARSGSEEAAMAFERMGISLKNTDGTAKPTEKVLGEVADRFKDVKDPTERAAMAFELFGKQGIKVVNALKDGAKGLEDFKKAAASKILSDADVAQLEKVRKATAGGGRWAMAQIGRGIAAVTDAGGTGRMAWNLEHAGDTAGAGEAKAENAKKLAEAMAKLAKANRDLAFEGREGETKLAFLRKEDAALVEKIRASEEGSVEQIELQTQHAEKLKEINSALEDVHKKDLEKQKQKTEELDKQAKKAEHLKEVVFHINDEAGKLEDATRKLSEAKGDRSKFTLEDLAGMNLGWGHTGAMNQQIYAARQVRMMENYGRNLAAYGNEEGSKEMFSRADKLRSGINALKEGERDPFRDINKGISEQTKNIAELIRKASEEGIVVVPVNGN